MGKCRRNLFLIIICRALLLERGLCQNISDTENLYTSLLSNYNRNIRGNVNQSEPTEIGFAFHVSNLVSFDEVSATFSVSGYFTIIWRDERMMWNETECNGISSINFPQNDVWIPKISMSNSMKAGESLYLGNNNLLVRYRHDGVAFWYPGQLFKSFCAPDVRNFPFDHQVTANSTPNVVHVSRRELVC